MEEIKRELERVVKVLFGVEVDAEVTVAEGQKFADGREVDFASNVAMRLAGELKRAPREIAAEILNAFSLEEFEGEVAGPGFLNFYVADEYYLGKMAGLAEDFEKNISLDEYAGQTVICEFSDPNPFKVLHVGHLYTSVVGDAISRLFEYAGARVVRANFGGDVGLHVAKNLYYLKDKYDELNNLNTLDEKAELMAKCYVEGTNAYEDGPRAKSEIDELNKEIYEINASGKNDTKLAQAYWAGREASYEYFKEFYARLGVEFDKYYPESEVAGRGLREVEEHPEVYVDSDGAKVFRGEEYGLHTRVFVNKMGLPTYEAKDVGLLFTKWDDFKFDKSVVITGNEIIDYMKVVLKSVEMYAPELVERTVHLTHGMVRLPGREKMSSRKGNFLRAVDVINLVESFLLESSSSADALLSRRMSNTSPSATPASLDIPNRKDSQKLVMAALKYAFLKYKMGGEIEFDVKSSVAVTGNSGIYLEYAVVRAKKILERVGLPVPSASSSSLSADGCGHPTPTARGAKVSHRAASALNSAEGTGNPTLLAYQLSPAERSLIKKICQYKDVLAGAVAEVAPHLICKYLYELAQEFSRFYEKVQVVGSEYEHERGRIVACYLAVLEHGLKLLGIETVEEM